MNDWLIGILGGIAALTLKESWELACWLWANKAYYDNKHIPDYLYIPYKNRTGNYFYFKYRLKENERMPKL